MEESIFKSKQSMIMAIETLEDLVKAWNDGKFIYALVTDGSTSYTLMPLIEPTLLVVHFDTSEVEISCLNNGVSIDVVLKDLFDMYQSKFCLISSVPAEDEKKIIEALKKMKDGGYI